LGGVLQEGITHPRYVTAHWFGYTAARRDRGLWLIWLAPPDGSPGRPAVFLGGAVRFCRAIKVLF